MSKLWPALVHQQFNLLLLEEVIDLVQLRRGRGDVLLRVSEREKFDRIFGYGTDRGGYPGRLRWRHSCELGVEYLHEDVLIATTVEENRRGEQDPGFSTSLKKIPGIERPLLLLYDGRKLERVRDKEYRFVDPGNKLDALIAVIPIVKLPPIEGWFSETEGLFYRSLVMRVGAGTVVEVGVWKGRSTAFIGPACSRRRNRLICVDSWQGSADRYDLEYRRRLAEEDVGQTFCRNMWLRRIRAEPRRSPSAVAAQEVEPRSVDLVFLDASHDYDSVTEDVRLWYGCVKPGGVLAGHDFQPEHPGVVAAVSEFAAEQGHRLRRGPGSIWYIDKRVD